MPFHALFRDEISDSFGMDSHSEEVWVQVVKQKKAVAFCTAFSEKAFKKNDRFCKLKKHICAKREFIAMGNRLSMESAAKRGHNGQLNYI
jgi:hypothetical protein